MLCLCRAPVRTLVSGARDKDTSALYIASSLLVYYSKNEVHSLDITSPECLRHIYKCFLDKFRARVIIIISIAD